MPTIEDRHAKLRAALEKIALGSHCDGAVMLAAKALMQDINDMPDAELRLAEKRFRVVNRVLESHGGIA